MTANKQLLSQYGAELLQAAEDHGAFLRFEVMALIRISAAWRPIAWLDWSTVDSGTRSRSE